MKNFYLCVIASLFFLPAIMMGKTHIQKEGEDVQQHDFPVTAVAQEAAVPEEQKTYSYSFVGMGYPLQDDFDPRTNIKLVSPILFLFGLNGYVGRRFSKHWGAMVDVLFIGPRVVSVDYERTIAYLDFLTCSGHYYVLPEQEVSLFIGLGLALDAETTFSNIPVYDRDPNARDHVRMKVGISAVPPFAKQYLRLEAGYSQNLGVTRREVGPDRVYRFGYITLNLQIPIRDYP